MTVGRPLADIDWKKVDDLLVAGCSGIEIASYFGLHKQTIYERCEKDHGISFTEYSSQKYAKGDSIIRAHQFAKAIGKTTEGDNTLLIWLGKNRLKQRDIQESGLPPGDNNLNTLIADIKDLKGKINAPEPKTDPELQ